MDSRLLESFHVTRNFFYDADFVPAIDGQLDLETLKLGKGKKSNSKAQLLGSTSTRAEAIPFEKGVETIFRSTQDNSDAVRAQQILSSRSSKI